VFCFCSSILYQDSMDFEDFKGLPSLPNIKTVASITSKHKYNIISMKKKAYILRTTKTSRSFMSPRLHASKLGDSESKVATTRSKLQATARIYFYLGYRIQNS